MRILILLVNFASAFAVFIAVSISLLRGKFQFSFAIEGLHAGVACLRREWSIQEVPLHVAQRDIVAALETGDVDEARRMARVARPYFEHVLADRQRRLAVLQDLAHVADAVAPNNRTRVRSLSQRLNTMSQQKDAEELEALLDFQEIAALSMEVIDEMERQAALVAPDGAT